MAPQRRALVAGRPMPGMASLTRAIGTRTHDRRRNLSRGFPPPHSSGTSCGWNRAPPVAGPILGGRALPSRCAGTRVADECAVCRAHAVDIAWRITRRPGDPPITRMIVELNRRPFLISDARARQELRYQPVITRQQGIQRLRDATRATVQPANPGM